MWSLWSACGARGILQALTAYGVRDHDSSNSSNSSYKKDKGKVYLFTSTLGGPPYLWSLRSAQAERRRPC